MDYKQKYKQTLKGCSRLLKSDSITKKNYKYIFPEPKESDGDRIRKSIIELVKQSSHILNPMNQKSMIAWLEKQGEPRMVKWKGDNLREVLEFTGKNENFDKWFTSFEEFEKYVHEHNDIFKIFNEDGSHYEIPVGAWIVKTPDGYNTPSRFGFVPRFAEWSEEDEKILLRTLSIIRYGLSIPIDKEDDPCFVGSSTISWLKSLREKLKGE